LTPQDLIYQIETDVMLEIARLLKTGAIGSAEWKIEKMRKLGLLNAYVVKLVKNYAKQIEAGTLSAVEDAAYQAIIRSDVMFAVAQKAGATLLEVLPAEADPAIRQTIAAWQALAGNQTNLCLTTLLDNTPDVYVKTINMVVAEVLTGATTSHEALVKAVRKWGQDGIPSIIDGAGRQWSTEAYANMVIRTNTTNVAHQVQDQRIQQYGADLIEISSHAGSRPGCAPFQGKIYSLSGQGKEYPPLSSTSYGQAGGVFGINCGHFKYPFWPGVSTQTYRPIGNNEELCKESQRQRFLERSIRAAKRDLEIVEKTGGDSAMARKLVKDRQATMREFIEETNRTRQYGREQVYK
jgi:hypothetical protein